MKVFAISDLHLSADQQKPMDVFGMHWFQHAEKIAKSWQESVTPEDVVLIPGDLSWAMTLEQVKEDFAFLRAMPGKKIILRGNHDYWWSSLTKVRALADENTMILQNNAYRLGEYVICGSRGWNTPLSSDFNTEDLKIYQREVIRLELSFEAAQKVRLPGDKLICMMHYPPVLDDTHSTGFKELIERYHTDMVIYGHLHGPAVYGAFQGVLNDVQYKLVSCDSIQFSPIELLF